MDIITCKHIKTSHNIVRKIFKPYINFSRYETENKIFGEEQGKVHNKGTDDEALKAFGYYKYTGLDNVEYRVDYTADENGFVPQGAHLHPVPESVKRTLEYLKQKGLL